MIKLKDKVINQCSSRRLLYTFCFFLFCVIDQRTKTCSGLDGWLETFRDMTGIVMAVLIMSHYRPEDFSRHKLPYFIWSLVAAVGGILAFVWGMGNRPFLNDWLVIILDVVLFGYIVIHTYLSVIVEGKHPRLHVGFFAVWVVMMLLMVASRSTYLWPLCYFVMFGCFYLTDFTQQEREDMTLGMMDGIILGFVVFQGLCFVFRPYDMVRYQGLYHNPNLNSLFYLEVLAAVFARLIYNIKKKRGRVAVLFCWIGAGVALSYLLLTIGRTAWLTAILLVGLFLVLLCRLPGFKRLLKNLLALCLCVVLTFPLCFGASRYLPPVFHHPVWFWGEWSEERVHSFDPWDSEKYIELDEYAEAALGRVLNAFSSLLEHSPLAIRAKAASAVREQDDRMIPVLTPEQEQDTLLVRSTIYRYYWKHLNLLGHPYEEQGFQLHERYWIGHAHNIFLQYGTDFGIPVMVLFIVLIVWGSVFLFRCYARGGDETAAADLMFLLVPALFGMLECSWGVGSLSILMMFMAWRKAIRNGE